MSDCVRGRKVPEAVARLWARATRGTEGMEDYCTAASDLDADGDLDWILSSGGQNLIVDNANPPRELGQVFGQPPRVIRSRERGRFVLQTLIGYGPNGSSDLFYVFDGKRYVEGRGKADYH
jgi:hypothetical protein